MTATSAQAITSSDHLLQVPSLFSPTYDIKAAESSSSVPAASTVYINALYSRSRANFISKISKPNSSPERNTYSQSKQMVSGTWTSPRGIRLYPACLRHQLVGTHPVFPAVADSDDAEVPGLVGFGDIVEPRLYLFGSPSTQLRAYCCTKALSSARYL